VSKKKKVPAKPKKKAAPKKEKAPQKKKDTTCPPHTWEPNTTLDVERCTGCGRVKDGDAAVFPWQVAKWATRKKEEDREN
jgi:hypothetical protein